ncbi:MAG: hypothetical protein IPH69_01010 [Bacteroidales bacterium]|nr:hypothetical protein [Bacteroidales bacterium]
MKNLIWLMLLLSCCTAEQTDPNQKLSLAGEWKFKIDSLNSGIENRWYEMTLEEIVKLPGSMAENGKGYEVDLNTPWTGDIVDKTYFTDARYAKYREKGNIKIPFWLKPVKYYKGAAWYQKEFDLPAGWDEKNVILFLERPHWESTVYVNGKKAGSENSLAVPHQFDITDLLVTGKNRISIRIDNSIVIPVGVNSHSISDHTQSNWNGIAGDISLRATSRVLINEVRVYPDIKTKTAKVIVAITNNSGKTFEGNVILQAGSFNTDEPRISGKMKVSANTASKDLQLIIDYPLGNKMQMWSEFNPVLYKLNVSLEGSDGNLIDKKSEDFGMREFKVEGTRFAVNDTPVFLRGTTECAIFPLTGYPPTDYESWEKVLQTCRDYGLNHVRFHSFCPPEAAFEAADRLGIYFHIECSSWANQGTSIGDGGTIDRFIYEEGDRIIKEYGNHPSFCMLAYGNEPAGGKQKEYLGQLLTYWKAKDNRRVYTSAAGWPIIPENDYNLSPEPRIQHWGEGLKSIINATPPQTMFDFREYVSGFSIPTVSHEIGQWCVYPDFKEIEKYTGVLKATNFEIFRETLNDNGMGEQAEDFLMASGKLQVLCYKAEIEAALRTPGFAGFQILQLHDFPGQGTALVGILNPLFESKGYVTPEEFRMFCNETVPLARMEKHVFLSNETFKADIEISHFGESPLKDNMVICKLIMENMDTLTVHVFKGMPVGIRNCISIGSFSFDLALAKITKAQKIRLEVSIDKTPYVNSWDFWVYPEKQQIRPGNVLVTETLDKNASDVLKKGGSVLLLTYGKVGKAKGAQVAIGFSSIFWNTAWTNNQPPHTLGFLCDPKHPLFSDFPTEYHSNWQWWDPVTHSQAMIIDGFPAELHPLIQPIDTWFENRRLALAFEAKAGNGKLFVCSIDLKDKIEERPVSKQLLLSLLNYMNGKSFDPQIKVDLSRIKSIME